MRSRLLLLAAGLAALAAASCTSAEEGGGGGAAPSCSGASCGTGGAGGEPGRCPDRSLEGGCVAAGSCVEGEECTVAGRRCPEGGCCTLPFSCEPAVGGRPGGTLCEEDGDCVSGVCLEIRFDLKVCLRACQLVSGGDSCPLGSTCQVVPLTGDASVRACLGGEPGAPDPEQTYCRGDRDCLEGRSCSLLGASAVARPSDYYEANGMVGVCRVPEGASNAGQSCAPFPPDGSADEEGVSYSATCGEGELCFVGCIFAYPEVCHCTGEELLAGTCRGLLCTKACRGDGDCPNRMVCKLLEADRFVFEPQDLTVGLCQWPFLTDVDWGCFDELDCCKNGLRPGGEECCDVDHEGFCGFPRPAEQTTYCRVLRTETRYTTQCSRPEAKAALGAPCATDADCESALCVGDGAGGSSCSTPCTGRLDRCEQILPGTSCCPTQSGAFCLEACRSDCEVAPVCTP